MAAMLVEKNVPLQACNTFHIVARAHALVRIASEADVQAVLNSPEWGSAPRFVLGGGSNIVLTGDVAQIDQPYLDALSNGLSYLINRMMGQPIYAHVTLEKGERSALADLASEVL